MAVDVTPFAGGVPDDTADADHAQLAELMRGLNMVAEQMSHRAPTGHTPSIQALRNQVTFLTGHIAALAERPVPPPPAPVVPDYSVAQRQLEVLAEWREQNTVNATTIYELQRNLGQTQDVVRVLAEATGHLPGVAAPAALLPGAVFGAGPAHHMRMKPDLPHFNGRGDPEVWIRQVADVFRAYGTPLADQFDWAKIALKDLAADFWFYECSHLAADMPTLFQALRSRFRPPTTAFDAAASWKTLRMSHGNFQEYLRSFNELRGRVQRHLSAEEVLETFVLGLTAEYQQEIKYHGADSLQAATDRCLRFAYSRTQGRVTQLELRDGRRRSHQPADRSQRSPSNSAQRASAGPSFTRGRSPSSGRFHPRPTSASRPTSPARTTQAAPRAWCPNCRISGHTAAQCRTYPSRTVHFPTSAVPTATSGHASGPPQGRGRGRGGRGGRVSPRGNGGR